MENSQHPHVVIGDIILLQPRTFLKLQILDVFSHLRTQQHMGDVSKGF